MTEPETTKTPKCCRRWIFVAVLLVSLLANGTFAWRIAMREWPWMTVALWFYSPPVSTENDQPFAYAMMGPLVNTITPTDANGDPLPETLIITPGSYKVFGKTYDLSSEGLYRFVDPGRRNIQRIVYQDNPDAIINGLAWITSHGNADEELSNSELISKAMESKLSLTCGPLSDLAMEILTDAGLKTRVVSAMTLDTWNSYNNGHVLIEVYREKHKKWGLFDLDSNTYFSQPDSKVPLSLLEFVDAVATDRYEIHLLAADTRMDISGFRSKDGFDWTFLMEQIQTDLRPWYKRVMQVGMIRDDGAFYFSDAENKERIQTYNSRYKFLDHKAFNTRFYPTESKGQ